MAKNILIIEDDAVLMYGLKAKFSSVGLAVRTHNGLGEIKDVLNIIRNDKPGLVVLDLILPDINGFDLLHAIRSEITGHKVIVFIYTNSPDSETAEKCERLGADYFFLKSEYNIDEFVEKVNKINKNLLKNQNAS